MELYVQFWKKLWTFCILYYTLHFFAQHEQKFQKKLDSTRGLKQNTSNLKKILLFFGG